MEAGLAQFVHTSVLEQEVLENLVPFDADGLIIDCTLGEGGHSAAFLSAYSEARVLGLDADASVIGIARSRLESYGSRFDARHAWFDQFFAEYPAELQRPQVVLFDLGISLFHYEKSGRGFSFHKPESLDMRLDSDLETSAFDIVNEYPEDELASLFFEFGEERYGNRIAAAISRARLLAPISNSADLADLIERSVPGEYRRGRIHAATRSFQALRIVVNGEPARLKSALNAALRVLAVGGRVGVISFHSLEDRIVKHFFRLKNSACTCPPEWPVCTCGGAQIVEILTKRPIRPTESETEANHASRSAKFRVVQKISEEVQ